MRTYPVVRVLVFGCFSLSLAATMHAAPGIGMAAVADGLEMTSNFSVNAPTQVPGATLKPGIYLLRLVDHLTDRTVLRVETKDGKVVSTFLGLPNRRLDRNHATGPVLWPSAPNHDMAVRGFAFPGGETVEFVYPKAEAVQLAVANSEPVEAIDPASDNLPSHTKSLSHDDMQLVTLWTLSPTPVAPGSTRPGVSAARYQAPAPPAQAPVNEASNTVPPRPAAVRNRTMVASAQSSAVASVKATPAKRAVTRRPIASALPQTASSLPLVWMLAVMALIGVAILRVRRAVTVR